MARTGRPTTNPASLDRAALVAGLAILGTHADPIARVKRASALYVKHSDGFALATATNMLGGTRRGHVRRAMVAAQNGACFTCGVTMDSAPETMAVLFRLIPSIVGADEFVSGTDAMAAGSLPGNVVAACVTCNSDRNAASDALGSPVCVTSDSMVAESDGAMLNASLILFVWPKGKGTRSPAPAHVASAALRDGSPTRMDARRAARLARLGW